MHTSLYTPSHALWRLVLATGFGCALLLSTQAHCDTDDLRSDLQVLTDERELLTRELQQYQTTMKLLHRGGKRPAQAKDPVVQRLSDEIVELKKRVIAVTEREVALLQELISVTKLEAENPPDANDPGSASRPTARSYSLAEEAEQVKRLLALLAGYYAELEESALILPSEQELEQRIAALRDIKEPESIWFSPDKVHLTGAEGSTALTQITQRLTDPDMPESRRDMAPICAIKTRLFGALIASESRSLRPVGKYHFVARVRLQPGDTSLRIREQLWEVKLPKNVSGSEFLITLYTPPGSKPELHLFAVAELLAEEDPHLPAWLPDELKISARAG